MILDIEKLSHEGRGIAHLDGKLIFVEGALSGERVEAAYTSRRGRFDEARAVDILAPSPERVEPPCPYASICGGCSLQHFDARAQLAFKEAMLHERLAHGIGREDYLRLAAVTGPVFHYRSKARLAVRFVAKKQRVLVGFREKGGGFITDMSACEILDRRAGALLPVLSDLIGSLESYRTIPQIEVAAGDEQPGSSGVALVFRHLRPLSEGDRLALAEFAEREKLDLYLQPGGTQSVTKLFPGQTEERLHYRLVEYGLDMRFHPLDFIQVNAEINHKMIARALELLDVRSTDRVWDLFCGLGNFTLPLARSCGWVSGMEGSEEMVLRARENARLNGIANADFHVADLSAPLDGQDQVRGTVDKILLDPPRSGALEVLPVVAAARPEKILYISCDPSTLARDAGRLEELGYRLKAAGVLDMFPHTAHVESMALFEPR